jgi:hypothetical protein
MVGLVIRNSSGVVKKLAFQKESVVDSLLLTLVKCAHLLRHSSAALSSRIIHTLVGLASRSLNLNSFDKSGNGQERHYYFSQSVYFCEAVIFFKLFIHFFHTRDVFRYVEKQI